MRENGRENWNIARLTAGLDLGAGTWVPTVFVFLCCVFVVSLSGGMAGVLPYSALDLDLDLASPRPEPRVQSQGLGHPAGPRVAGKS